MRQCRRSLVSQNPTATRSSTGQCVGPSTFHCLLRWPVIYLRNAWCSLPHDTQLYVDFSPNDSASAADQISRCVIDVKAWLASRYLLLNEAKTETILFTTPIHRTPQPHPLVIDICGRNVTTSASIRDLGVHLDSTL